MSTFRRRPIYEGPEKIVYEGPEPGTFIQHFKDFSASEPGVAVINGHGIINNRISELLLRQLNDIGLPTYFIRGLNMREQLVRALEPIGVQVHIRNIMDDELVEALGTTKGTRLPRALLEFSCTKGAKPGRLLSPENLNFLGWANEEEIETMQAIALRSNDFLSGYFSALDLVLVDFKLEFGRVYYPNEESQIVISEGITPDRFQLWDTEAYTNLSGEGNRGYYEIAQRLGVLPPNFDLPED